MSLSRLFLENERANAELVYSRPKNNAKDLLTAIKGKLTIQASIDEIDKIISEIKKM